MKLTRRDFVKTSAVGVAGILAYKAALRSAYAFYQSTGLPKFGQPLRGVGQIPLATKDTLPAPVTGVAHYTMDISQFTDTLHPNLGATTLWGYNPALNGVSTPLAQRHLGGIFVVNKGAAIQVTFRNQLPTVANSWGQIHPLPVDKSAFFQDAQGVLDQNRMSVHMHGGHVPWISDGGPFDYFSPSGTTGPSFLNNQVLNPGASPGSAEYYYPNDQSARLMWYHDHYHDLTRLNAYGGVASAYVVRDKFEAGLVGLGMPNYVELGGFEIPLVFQDKIFVDGNQASLNYIGLIDPTWPGPRTTGSLWYPHIYETNRWKLGGNGSLVPPDPSCIPEMFGDTMLVNGVVSPELHIQPRRYRLRLLNACNARFLNLQLWVVPSGATAVPLNPKTLLPTAPATPGPNFLQIGTEGGMLPHPVVVSSSTPFNPVLFNGSLLTAPAERPDVIVDFSGLSGKTLILYNDAPAPFPVGDPRNDYFMGAPKNPAAPLTAGVTPDTRNILRIVVDQPLSLPADTTTLGFDQTTDFTKLTLNTEVYNDPLLASIVNNVPQVPNIAVRSLTLNETFDSYGRLVQYLGTNVPGLIKGSYGRTYLEPATENVFAGSTEIWEIANLTGDTHPIHFHLVNVQILNRQPFKVAQYNGTPSFTGPARPPDQNELGWKETVRMNPGEVTRVIMRFVLPAIPPGVISIPTSPRTGGYEYVWHCHILEHEEHDMMRPLIVSP